MVLVLELLQGGHFYRVSHLCCRLMILTDGVTPAELNASFSVQFRMPFYSPAYSGHCLILTGQVGLNPNAYKYDHKLAAIFCLPITGGCCVTPVAPPNRTVSFLDPGESYGTASVTNQTQCSVETFFWTWLSNSVISVGFLCCGCCSLLFLYLF